MGAFRVICCGFALALLGAGMAWAVDPVLPLNPANPRIRTTQSFLVPTKLKLGKSSGQATYALAPAPKEKISIKVGSGMVTGAEYKVYIYLEGEPRPEVENSTGLCNDVDALSSWTGYCSGKTYGQFPGRKYVLEVVMSIFETDVPPRPEWEPYSKNYKELWTGSVKETVD
ncbi:hypothetical protein BH09VER1_BH09VER1_55670 [soil metagenome]